MTAVPPSAAKRSTISLPMPLAAPVTIATFPEKRGIWHSFHYPSMIEHHCPRKTPVLHRTLHPCSSMGAAVGFRLFAAIDREIEDINAIQPLRTLQNLWMAQGVHGIVIA